MKRIGVLVFIIWFELLIVFAPAIDTYDHAFLVGRGMADVPFYLRLLGEGKSILSAISVLQADRYFHRGIGHTDEHHQEYLDEDHDDLSVDDVGQPSRSKKMNVFLRIPYEIGATEHMHLEQDQVKEIIPWLYYAVKMDPHNVQAYVLTAYWVIDRLGKTQEGINFLREGLKNNPDSWEINAELGRVYFQDTKDYTAAVRVLSRARRLLAGEEHDKFQEREVLSFLAYSYKALGQDEKARSVFLNISKLFPNDSTMKEKSKKTL